MDQRNPEAYEDRECVLGDEAWPVVDVARAHEAVPLQALVDASQEQLRSLGGADDDVQDLACRVVEVEQGDALAALLASPEVLAVTQHHVHPVRVGKTPRVTVACVPAPGQWQAEPLAGAVDGAALHNLSGLQDAALSGSADQLGNRCGVVFVLLVDEEVDECSWQHAARRDLRSQLGLESTDAACSVRGEPAVEGTRMDATQRSIEADVLAITHGADRGRLAGAGAHQDDDLGDDREAKQRLAGLIGLVTHGRGP